jgi:16S rRNA (cytosine1402-N4)-methyltransferase
MKEQAHQPVLLAEVLQLLSPQPGETYLDLTAGYGGHAAAVQAILGPASQLVLVDRDEAAVSALRKFKQALVIRSDFDKATQQFVEEGSTFDLILVDLGVSSPQLDTPSRGFSIRRNGPLDMRMDQRQNLTAADIVNRYDEQQLADLIYTYGEERRSRQIAKIIVDRRPFQDTTELADAIKKAYRSYSRIHPATRTFQALRLAVNQELEQLERTLPRLTRLLSPGGRVAVISFHSLEDRMVKQWIKGDEELTNLTPKVIQGRDYDATNPRARSAKLRAALKNKN